MAGAERRCIPGNSRHLTHRWHERDFPLRFGKDRRRWLHWLFEAGKRYGLCIVNCVAISSHIHLPVFDRGQREVVPRSMQLAAGRTARESN